ncbi:hypothetical protein ACFRJ9_02745 [Paenarthrobacter sp. NPDC056912]|uniref:hypothetical protein n=1 Tax=Paenarthrobacter sp. NPDC056912 TaxID=3345965 RepID=UPI0036722139
MSAKTQNVDEQQSPAIGQHKFDRLAAMIIGLATIIWGMIALDIWGEFESWSLFPKIAVHSLSAVTAVALYLLCRIRQLPTNVTLLIVLLGVAFFFIDVALAFQYSPFFGLALILLAIRRRHPVMAFSGALSLTAAFIARFVHAVDGPLILVTGVAVLGLSAWPAPSKR